MNLGVRSTDLEPRGVDAVVPMRLLDLLFLVSFLPLLAGLLGVDLDESYLLLLTSAMLLFLALGQIGKLYRPWRMRTLQIELLNLFVVWAVLFSLLITLAFGLKISAHFSRLLLGFWATLTPAAMAAWRGLRRWRARRDAVNGIGIRRVAFVGAGAIARRMAEHLSAVTGLGIEIVGVYDDRQVHRLSLADMELRGSTEDMLRDARAGMIDDVYVTLPMHAQNRIVDIVGTLADTTASVYVVPDSFLFDMLQASWAQVGGYPVISVYDTPFYGVDGSFKRLEDLVLGSLILILISPLMLALAVAIKLTSPGPVLFRQRRYGLNGRIVEIWKFRTMRVAEDGAAIVQAKRGDPRVTRLGAILRRTSLDELPQFINVLQGRMSIVGPRPHAIAHNEEYRRLIHGYMLRHKVKPGITGWAQVNGWRGETDTIDKMKMRIEYDLYYLRHWSLAFDLRIIALTILRGFTSRNAY